MDISKGGKLFFGCKSDDGQEEREEAFHGDALFSEATGQIQQTTSLDCLLRSGQNLPIQNTLRRALA
jgi:hypothetical protein